MKKKLKYIEYTLEQIYIRKIKTMGNIILVIFIGIILCPLLIYIISKLVDDPQITYKDGEYTAADVGEYDYKNIKN